MKWYERFMFWRKAEGSVGRPPSTSKRARATQGEAGKAFNYTNFAILPPPDAEGDWRVADLDTDWYDSVSVERMVELLIDLSPEVSRALWDYLRFCNPGYELVATRPGTDDPDEAATARLHDFVSQWGNYYGIPEVVFNRAFMSLFMRGGLFCELVLDDRGRAPVDLPVVDASTVRFRKTNDPQRGPIWELGQQDDMGKFVSLQDIMTVRYVPLDPPPKSPYGRAMISPSLYASLFLLGMLHDLRRVVAQQGYPRLDLEIDLEALLKIMPAELKSKMGSSEMREWVQDVASEIGNAYSNLQPDDAYVHTSDITVNRPVGTLGSDALGAVDGIIEAVERIITRSLKSTPLLMGTRQTSAETQSNREWEIYTASIKTIQHIVENAFSHLLKIALQVQGIQADVNLRFAELRASERLRDAQSEQMEIANAVAKRDQGWITQDEASEEITGHAAVTAAPSAAPAVPVTEPGTDPEAPVDGEERRRAIAEVQALRQALERSLNMQVGYGD